MKPVKFWKVCTEISRLFHNLSPFGTRWLAVGTWVSVKCVFQLLDLGSETELRAQKEALGREEAKASHPQTSHGITSTQKMLNLLLIYAKTRQGSVISHLLWTPFFGFCAAAGGGLLCWACSWCHYWFSVVISTFMVGVVTLGCAHNSVSSSPMCSVYCGNRDGKFSILRCTARFEALPT